MEHDFMYWVYEFAYQTVILELQLFLQTAVILAPGLLGAWFFRRRGAAFQSTVLRYTLVSIILCPLGYWAIARAGVSPNSPRGKA